MFWWVSGAVVVVALVALAWWSSGRKPGVIPGKSTTTDSAASDAHDAGGQAQRGLPPAMGG